MTRILHCTAALAALIALAACGGTEGSERPGTEGTARSLLNQQGGSGPSTPVEWNSRLAEQPTEVSVPDLGHNFGSPAAPLKILELSDYGCGYCRRFHQESFATLRAEFVETNQVEWKFMPFITGMFGNSLAVTEAAECALEQDVERYEAFSDRLWDRQGEWKDVGGPDAVVRSWMEELGGDMGRYDACLASDRRLERVAQATVVAQRLGVRGTPTFWVVGFGPLQGALPLDVFRGVLGGALADLEAAGTPSVAPSESDPADGN